MKRLVIATLSSLTILCFAGANAQQQSPSSASSHNTFQLKPTPKTISWGFYAASAPPVLRVHSVDTVEIQTLITSSPKALQGAGVPADQVEQSLRDIFDQVKDKGPGGHILTGPVYVEGAEPGMFWKCASNPFASPFRMPTTPSGRDAGFSPTTIPTDE